MVEKKTNAPLGERITFSLNRYEQKDGSPAPAPHEMQPLSYFDQAESFMYVSMLLANMLGQNKAPINQRVGLPFVTNFAYTAEMYLKTLIFIETATTPTRIHNLIRLFDLLSEDSKSYIQKEWNKRCQPTLEARLSEATSKAGIPRNLRAVLSKAANAFINFRYPQAGENSIDLHDFPVIVRERILQLKPEWGLQSPTHPFNVVKPNL